MSKERELLQSVMEESWDFLYAGTHTEIKELLAQPEQKPEPEQKPLTPQQISEGNQSMFNVTREAFKQGVKWAERHHGIGGGE